MMNISKLPFSQNGSADGITTDEKSPQRILQVLAPAGFVFAVGGHRAVDESPCEIMRIC